MKPARENHERPAGVADAGTVAADTVVVAKVASEEATKIRQKPVESGISYAVVRVIVKQTVPTWALA